ncbi:hypothetical protein F5Y14DRAFT_135202 [Nemania sp. NC0429]|nr:hypothetical protein F5Y14DRAFT_135202 [Nemania sp. NC0429]
MPRKVRLPANATQNRENQQRSRARRREHLASLEARVRDFEQRGVRASAEMQRAAREVTWVNERLVELLAERGVARGEVDEFLRRRREEMGRGSTVGDSPRYLDLNRGSGSCRGSRGEVARVVSAVVAEGASSSETGAREGARTGAGADDMSGRSRVSSSGPDRQSIDMDTRIEVGTSVDMSTPARAKCGDDKHVCDGTSKAPKRCADTDEGSSALLTSCDDAASIIARFQGHGDVLHARETLGCGDATNCHVKNTRLFQLMDEA